MNIIEPVVTCLQPLPSKHIKDGTLCIIQMKINKENENAEFRWYNFYNFGNEGAKLLVVWNKMLDHVYDTTIFENPSHVSRKKKDNNSSREMTLKFSRKKI